VYREDLRVGYVQRLDELDLEDAPPVGTKGSQVRPGPTPLPL
jgi:hypothetical protein